MNLSSIQRLLSFVGQKTPPDSDAQRQACNMLSASVNESVVNPAFSAANRIGSRCRASVATVARFAC